MGRRIRFFTLILSISFLILAGRLFQLQVIKGRESRFLAEENRIRKINIDSPRGIIFDRHGETLVQNEPVYLFEDEPVSRQEGLKLQEEGKEGKLRIVLKRKYLGGEVFAHLLGYLGEVTQEEFVKQKLGLRGYLLGSLIGRQGVEAQYENLLKGRDGSELIEVDTQGKTIRRMGRVLPTAGENITLAVDKKLQEVAALAMGEKKGAVVASNPKNGEILILYSSPSFDPNLLLDKKAVDKLVEIFGDEENHPLLDRVISGVYSPGSVFKMVTAIAGLEEGKITSSTTINDPGVITIGSYKYSNWYFTGYGRTEGEINLERALARSTDTFFYKLGEYVGIEKLNFWTEKFGLNQKYGIDLPGEVAGFMATPEWKQESRGEKWFLGNTYHYAIGQGDLILTPLGVNMISSVIANEGKVCIPRILRLEAKNTPYLAECRDIGIDKQYLEVVKRGMIGACSAGGTAYPFFDFAPPVACKTGTAETGEGKTTHAWFTVIAPADDPQIALSVLVERGGEGSSVAAPIAKEVLKEYFLTH